MLRRPGGRPVWKSQLLSVRIADPSFPAWGRLDEEQSNLFAFRKGWIKFLVHRWHKAPCFSPSSFCVDCLNILVGAGTFERLMEVDPWSCYLCIPSQRYGVLKSRLDWSFRVQAFFVNNSGMEFVSVLRFLFPKNQMGYEGTFLVTWYLAFSSDEHFCYRCVTLKSSGVQSCAMEGREYAGFHSNQSLHQLILLMNTSSIREEGTNLWNQ